MKLFICLLLIFLTFPFVHSQNSNRGAEVTTTKSSSGKTYAIIIGVSKYDYLDSEQQLNYADSDAVLIKNYFETWENIEFKLFLNKNATPRDRIGMEIEKTLLKDAQSGDKVILFFAGHGDLDEIYGDGYLLLNQVKPANDASYKWNDALSLNSLKESINKADQKGVEVYLIADACHSGSVLNTAANSMISGLSENSVTMISCKKGQVSIENKNLGHGVFTYHLIQGLNGLADIDGDKIVTLVELENHVRNEVRKETNGLQQPIFEGKDENMEIAKVNETLLSLVKKNSKNAPIIASSSKARSLSKNTDELSNECIALLKLLEEQATDKKFFAKQLDSSDLQIISIGKVQSKKNHTKSVNTVCVSNDGLYLASASEDGIVCYENWQVKKPVWNVGKNEKITCIEFNLEGNLLASGSVDKKVILWNVLNGEKVLELSGVSDEVSSLKFISTGLLLIATVKGKVYFSDLSNAKMASVKMNKAAINQMELHYPYLFTAGNDGKISVYNLITKKIEKTISAHEEGVNGLKYLALSKSLLTIGNEGKLKKWDPITGKLLNETNLGFKELNCIDTDPFEMFCFVGSEQKKISIFDLQKNQVIKFNLSGTSGIKSIRYQPQNHSLILGEYDGSVTIQEIKVQPTNSSVMEIRESILNCSGSTVQKEIDALIISELNVEVSKVLNSLVNGNEKAPDLSQIQTAKLYAEQALVFGDEIQDNTKDLEINKLLLEVYEILLMNDKDKFQQGINNLKRIEELDPKGAYLYNVSAQLYAKMNDMTKAKELAAKAEELAPNWSEATMNHAKILVLAGDQKGAEIKFKEVIKESPKLSKGYASLGELYFTQGNYEEANINLGKAIKIDSSIEFRLKMYEETLFKLGKQKIQKVDKTIGDKYILSIGDDFAGGIILYLDESGKHGFVCAPYSLGKHNWSKAKSICDDLDVSGYTDWRLPKMTELSKCAKIGNQLNGFENANFWTSTEADTANAWWITLSDSSRDKSLKSNVRFVIAIRSF